MIRGIHIAHMYDVDDSVYPYVASDSEGRLCGFVNPPVRDFSMREWIDSVTGSPGDLIPYERWDQSLRETKEMMDHHASKKPKKPEASSVCGKKGMVRGEGEFTKYKYKLIDTRKKQ